VVRFLPRAAPPKTAEARKTAQDLPARQNPRGMRVYKKAGEAC
jgi:hypothetical protein